ncbi:ribonuclease D [Marinobacter daqiaonensis]|uniref:Ribonuclease D n=1 Tax=Marinobacter daqiaonensis TaxID=650891 RepID=A0A1I6GXK6_9GAMM|nr:HRDC domain-containing protein [Marinobacter daqiaonensis]SFR46809.1 ribonuclease D [Marinobacter daqiaonensis]
MTLATPLAPPYPVPAEPKWLESVDALDAWLAEYQHEPLALDTEFERVSTFYPIPGLVQLGAGDSLRLAEPSVAVESARFRETLADPGRPKLLYAMGEDLELFRHWLALEPRGLLDLQLGAALAGAGFSVGYARIVEQIFGETLDKSATRSDWLARPLSDAQQRYALDDVRFLAPLYQWIADRLRERGLSGALSEESDRFAMDLLAFSEPGDAYLKLRGGWHLAGSSQQVLKALVAWREEECRRRDRPRNRVLADAALINIADRLPENTGALAAVEGVPPVVVRRFGDTLLAVIREALESGGEPDPLIDRPLTRPQQELYRKVKKQMAGAADQWDVPVELLAPRKKLEALLRAGARAPEALEAFASGWRGKVLAPVLDDIRTLLDERADNNE